MMNWWSHPSDPYWWGAASASFLLSALVTWLSIRYARRRNLLDLPGQRRSHSAPTPRGGGLGIVVAVLAGLVALPWFVPAMVVPVRLICAVALVAAVGWIDDHRPLPAWSRLLVHCIAIGLWLAPLFMALVAASPSQPVDTTPLATAGVIVLLGFACVWSINLHNFMDGIDGLLALQAIFVLSVLTLLCVRDTESVHPLQTAMWLAAIAGFTLFNFPRAHVFMGDVGSGAIGLLLAVAVIWQISTPQVAAASGIIAASAFVADATCTLLSRMLRGRHWYSAHREHLYQWMARAGMSHARVVGWYMGWNLLIVLPVLWWINRIPAQRNGVTSLASGYMYAVAVYALAVALWIFGKRWCEHKVRTVK
ncbi:MAG: glycosyltransferase family 4 protein [Rudaea sp.]|nr:glycosyltransferase family 4 protein [Rudaea sp.]